MGKDTFLKLLVAQLKYQNPLSPTDGAQYMAQLAQFTQVEKLSDISAAQTDASSWQRAVVGEGMLGKTVTGADSTGKAVTDSVVGMQITDKGPLLTLKNGGTMDVSAVTSVTQSATSATAAT
jgi:flagellar basal-body rod modification protein FlgD